MHRILEGLKDKYGAVTYYAELPFPHTRIFVRSITILEFLKIAVYRGNLRAKFQGHSSATSCEEGNKTRARRRHDVVRNCNWF